MAELWLVDSEADSVHVYRRPSREAPAFDVEFEVVTGEQLTTPLLPGFALDLGAVFDR